EASKTKMGVDHPDTLTSMGNLAVTWHLAGRVRDAIILMQQCVALQERKLGPDHPRTASSFTALAAWEKEADLHTSNRTV
ncbi:hypothetical protein BGZ63DRAFT_350117, partial [Mariannaea sp. PMI_226]